MKKSGHSHSSSPNDIFFVFICEMLIYIFNNMKVKIFIFINNNGVTKKRSRIIVKLNLKYKIRIEIIWADLYKTKRRKMMETRRRNKWGRRNWPSREPHLDNVPLISFNFLQISFNLHVRLITIGICNLILSKRLT